MSDTNQQTIDAYNQSLEAYIQSTPQQVNGHIKVWLDSCIAQLTPDPKILEVGVGHGKDADYLESKGLQVTRTDASTSFVEYQKRQGHEAQLLNVLTDDFPGTYDLILADAVWLHFTPEEAKLATQKVFEALEPNGLFAFSIKEGEGTEITDRKLNHARYFCYWSKPDIEKLLQETGFTAITVTNASDYRPGRPGWLLITAQK